MGKAKESDQHSAREAGCVISDFLQRGFFERQSCSYLKAVVMRTVLSKVPKDSLRRLCQATAEAN